MFLKEIKNRKNFQKQRFVHTEMYLLERKEHHPQQFKKSTIKTLYNAVHLL